MPLGIIFSALAMVGIGECLKWFLTRKWARLSVNPKTVVFPQLCPVCLSANAASTLDEESAKRQTANYVVARKMEWWRAAVPHCSKCSLKLSRNKAIGVVLGAACTVTAVWLTEPSEVSFLLIIYILFGYPAYIVATTIQKGIVFGSAGPTAMWVYIRHAEYFTRLTATPVSLANNKGVWQRHE